MRHALTRRLPYSPDQLFELVGDVAAYPLFVPWITQMRLGPRRETGPGVWQLDAEAKVGFAFIKERFATRVRLDRPGLAIDADLISGPFRKLENRWRFHPAAGGGTELQFQIDFEFGSRLLQGVLAANFERAVARLIGCFERRAAELYGPGRSPPSSETLLTKRPDPTFT